MYVIYIKLFFVFYLLNFAYVHIFLMQNFSTSSEESITKDSRIAYLYIINIFGDIEI